MLQNRSAQDLKSNKFFTGIKDTLVSSIFNPKKFVQYSEGNIIYQTGDKSTGLYLLLHGEIKIKYPNSNYISTKVPNSFFGEKELIDDSPRISSAVANRNTVIYILDRSLFKRLYSNYAEIKKNVHEFGQTEIPEVQVEQKVNLKITEQAKPVSFKAFSTPNEEDPIGSEVMPGNDKSTPAPFTEIVELEMNESNKDEDTHLKQDLLEEPEDFKNWKFKEEEQSKEKAVPAVSEPIRVSQIEEPEVKVEIEEKVETEEVQFERENFRKILACIGVIHQGLSLFETTQTIIKALKDLTLSESVQIYLVNETSYEMKKFTVNGNSFSEEIFKSTEGLTGSCLLQKKILNLERPTEDTRFNSSIDQPGNARMKRILFFPVINESGETIAVIQLGRENKKFSDVEISELNIVSKQIETAIARSMHLQNVFSNERRSTINNLSNTIINEIRSPLRIINNYVDILHQKELPEGADDVIRMLQKQANSIEDLLISLFEHIRNEIKVQLKDIHFNEFIEDVLELISEYCESKEVKLYKKVGSGTVVSIDRGKLYTAIYQVVRQFGEQVGKGGKIYFSTDLVENSIVLLIKNEIPNSAKDSVNKMLEKSITGDYLHDPYSEFNIAKRIIEAHSGSFTTEFIKGEGTIISIRIPGKKI